MFVLCVYTSYERTITSINNNGRACCLQVHADEWNDDNDDKMRWTSTRKTTAATVTRMFVRFGLCVRVFVYLCVKSIVTFKRRIAFGRTKDIAGAQSHQYPPVLVRFRPDNISSD